MIVCSRNWLCGIVAAPCYSVRLAPVRRGGNGQWTFGDSILTASSFFGAQ